MTTALFANQLDVVAARACTLGDQVIDAFYVRDRETGAKVEGSARLNQIVAAIHQVLADSSVDA